MPNKQYIIQTSNTLQPASRQADKKTMTQKQELEAAFTEYVEAIGKRKATDWNDVGGLQLRFDTRGFLTGGYEIAEIINDGGGICITHYLYKTPKAAAKQLRAMAADARAQQENDKPLTDEAFFEILSRTVCISSRP